MAETAITTVLSKFGELATSEAGVLLQVGHDVMLLRDRFDWLQAFIRDADRKRRAGTDGLTLVWLRQTRDATFEAEDTLDYFFLKVDLESKGYGRWKTWQIYLTGWWSQVITGHLLSGKIKGIKQRLDDISENQTKYNINHSPSTIWTRSTTSLAIWDDQEVLDMEEGHGVEVGALVKMLDEEVGAKFISVMGESGSGKFTLVDHFCSKIWASDMKKYGEDKKELRRVIIWYTMPPGSSTEDLLKQVHERILQRVGPQNGDHSREQKDTDMAAKIRGLLDGKRYMMVLSGISSMTMLNCVSASLPDDNNGSRVVLILEPDAHGVEVARRAQFINGNPGQQSIIWFTRWTQARTLAVFRKLVTNPHIKADNKENFSEVGNKEEDYSKADNTADYDNIVYGITGGHPLAISVLAGLVRQRESDAEQKAVLDELKPPCSMDKLFAASYDDLSQDLKSCFLYFAAYSKNISQPADQIVRMWIAEGFIKPRSGRTLEELGNMYLEELISRRLVTRVGRKIPGVTEHFIVHNRLLEFLQSEARQASFMEVHSRNDVLAPASVRRLSVQDDGYGYTPFTTQFPKLRTFICRVVEKQHEEEEEEEEDDGNLQGSSTRDPIRQTTTTSRKSWWLAMLSCLEGVIPCLDDTEGGPEGNNGHNLNFLRWSKFLRLICVQGLHLKELPDEIGDMIHLRYLRVDSKGLRVLPCGISRLVNLQTLDIRNTLVEEIDAMFWTIKTLRHVLAEKLMLPATLTSEMGNLMTLHGVTAGKEKWDDQGNCPLHKMANLRSLELAGLEDGKHGMAMANALRNMLLLRHLKLQGDAISSCVVFTEPRLRCLQTVDLRGTVKWAEIPEGFVIRHVRPNLVEGNRFYLPRNNKPPQAIQEQLKAYVNINYD
ncbi:unnamed protein product [Urochloa decumbens]|uniref:Uncharacterized protein n=1 Tax=Urochloa decumbens TaxID=240449 RepID=A0ABC9B495_9POAL